MIERKLRPKEQAIYKLKVGKERAQRELGRGVVWSVRYGAQFTVAHAIRLNCSHYAHKFHDKCKSFAVQYATSSASNNSQ